MSESQANIWCLLGRKAGDNTQVRALAEALGGGFTEKQILARPWELLPQLFLRVTLAGIDRAASSELAPPWPELVISAGRRNEPVARWIRLQSGGRTRLVHVGRPWAALDHWDLIVSTPQYFLPDRANIQHNELPLYRLPVDDLAGEAERWRPRLVDLPRPWIAVLVGGDSGKFVFTPEKGARLGQWANRLAMSAGGSVVAIESPRTPKSSGDTLSEQLSGPHRFHRWGDGDNPYRGILALADAFVVTGESMSMLAEAASTAKPLYIFDMGDGGRPWWRLVHSYRYKPLSHRLAMALGPQRMRRDVGRIQSALVDGGKACWLGPDSRYRECETVTAPLSEEELAATAARVRQLLLPR
jgi:mitochondrial fission protein ELM1